MLSPPLVAMLTWRELPTVNASLNALATMLLVAGYLLIKGRRVNAHKWTMLMAFATSVVFLGCYLYYHYRLQSETGGHGTPFSGPENLRPFYYGLLISHVLLAAAVPFLAVGSIYLGLKNRLAAHRRLARWTWPIWLYVSVTGVLIYLILYHIYPVPLDGPILAVE